jgi:ketosteroid isomerase-like protein
MSEVSNMQETRTDVFEIISRITEHFVDAVKQQDVDALVQLYTEDGQHFREEDAPKGREALRAFHQGDVNNSQGEAPSTFSAAVTEAELLGNMAYGVGTWSFTPEGGAEAKGKWMSIYKNEGEEWKIHRVMSMNQAPSSSP